MDWKEHRRGRVRRELDLLQDIVSRMTALEAMAVSDAAEDDAALKDALHYLNVAAGAMFAATGEMAEQEARAEARAKATLPKCGGCGEPVTESGADEWFGVLWHDECRLRRQEAQWEEAQRGTLEERR